MLPGIANSPNDPVFVSWSGHYMASSMATSQMNLFWKAATNSNLSSSINPTLVRKMATTLVHEKEPDKKELVVIMNHDVRTAEKNYFLLEKKNPKRRAKNRRHYF